MPAQRGLKRKSEHTVASDSANASEMENQKIATKTGSPSGSPAKKRRIGITQAQKQALIDNLQLELTERARKLRAQYNLQAQGLRTRIEIRVNRIPMALRKVKMGDLLDAIANKQQRPKAPYTTVAAMTSRPPPVPEKDYYSTRSGPVHHGVPTPASRAGPGRPPKRPSDEISGMDKENHDINIENPKKRARGGPVVGHGPDPSKVLSPTSSNSRMNARERPAPLPPKSLIARPVSPVKQTSASNLLSTMVEKARSTRGTATRKATTSSTASSAAGGATATRARRGAAAQNPSATPAASHSRAAATTRIARRVSGVSESSDGSTSTVVRKTGARTAGATARAAAPPPSAKRTVMSTLKKGVTSAATRKAPASKTAQPAAPTTTRSGRVLRKRE